MSKKHGGIPPENLIKKEKTSLVSVIISAKDEGRNLGLLLPRFKRSFAGQPYEVVVVNDGSRDNTCEVARSNGSKVVSHKRSRGKGAAMKTGVANSRGDIIVFLDGDGAHEPEDILGVVTPVLENKAHVVIGFRCLPDSRVNKAPVNRLISNGLASIIISVLTSVVLPLVLFHAPNKIIKITDCTSGYRAIKRDTWRRLNLTSNGFQIETEMIYEAAKSNCTIVEVPITCKWDSSLSHLSILHDGTKTMWLLLTRLFGDIGGGRKIKKAQPVPSQ